MSDRPGDRWSGRLSGRVALVTGAGRGIGRAHAMALAALGATVIVNDPGGAVDGTPVTDAGSVRSAATEPMDEAADRRGGAGRGGTVGPSPAAPEPCRPGPAAAVVAEIGRAGGVAVADHTPVGTWEAAHTLVAAAVERFGRLDVVVANAGILRPRTIVGMTPEEWSDVLRVHLDGTMTLAHAAARHWRARAKAGGPLPARLVTTTSPAGLFGGGGQANYAAAKAGIVALTQVAATELAPYGATANAVAPVALTRMSEGMADATHEPEHAARLVAWLCTDAAAGVTGEVFLVGGGHVSVVARPLAGPGVDEVADLDAMDAAVPDLLARAVPHPDLLGCPPGRSAPPALAALSVPAGPPRSPTRTTEPDPSRDSPPSQRRSAP